MKGALLDLSTAPSPGELTVEVCVIGSGCSGATVAAELAAAGKEVVVLEEGGDYTGQRLTGRDAAMLDQLYVGRGGRMTRDMSINLLQGRVLGGGTVVNACDVTVISDGVARHWQKRHGLTDFAPEALAPFRQAALDDLFVSQATEEQLNLNNRLLRQGALALGWKGEVMLHNRVGCAGGGTCMLGCTLNAKRNARFVAIPRAIDAGARFFVRARALSLEQAETELKVVRAVALDARGYHEKEPFTVRAKHVVLAANAIGNAELLLRSGLGNAHVGRHLSLQPQLPLTALFKDEVRMFRGIPQLYAVTEFEEYEHPEHGFWGFRVESIGGTPGVIASLLPESGREGQERMRMYPRLAGALLLLPDEPVGSIRLEKSGRSRVEYALTEEYKTRCRKAVRAASQAYFAAGAEAVYVPVSPPLWIRSLAELNRIDSLTFAPATSPFISAHQQGTVRFSGSQKDGAASPDGEVYGTRGVYVFDSTGFPSSGASHTMAPNITVSRMLARKLLSRA